MGTKLSGSRLGILRQCGWAFRDDVSYDSQQSGRAASEGTAVHAAMEAYASETCGDQRLLEICAKNKVEVSVVGPLFESGKKKFKERVSENLYAEPAFAWRPGKRARLLGLSIERQYEANGLKPNEIPCSLDLVYQDPNDPDTWVVVDYKTGRADHVELPGENLQLKFGILCVFDWLQSKGINPKQVRGEIWKIRADRTWVDEHVFRPFDIISIRDELEGLMKTISFAPAKTGEKCTFCPALGSCPATQKQMAQVVEPFEGFEWSATIQSMEHASWMAERVSSLEKQVKVIRDGIREYAKKNGGAIPVGDKKVYREVSSSRKNLNQKALRAHYGDSEIDKFVHTIQVDSWRVVKR